MPEVPRIATPLLEPVLAAVLRDGHAFVFGAPPGLPRLRVAWAHNALEHASGKAVWNDNLGNVTVPAGAAGDFYVIPCEERVHKSTGPGDPDRWELKQMRFAAHGDAIDGARAYWTLLKDHYASAMQLFDSGNADAVARRLGALGYYTAKVEPYAAGMAGLASHFTAHVLPDLIGVSHDETIARVVTTAQDLALDTGARELARAA